MRRKTIFFLIVFFIFNLLFSRAFAEEVLIWGECVKEAQKNHPDLISAQEAIKQSKAGRWVTASTLFPQISSSLAASTSKTTTENSSGQRSSSTADSYSYGLSASQLIFDGFKTYNDIFAATENVKAFGYSYRFASSEVRQRLRFAFIALLREQELLNITQDIFKIRRENYELITLRYQSGTEHKGALLEAEANLAQAQFEISQAERNIEVAQRQLIKEMGRTKFAPVKVAGEFAVRDFVPEKPDFEALSKNNPSLEKLIAEKSSANFSLRSTYGNFLPQLVAESGAGRTSAHWPPQNDHWNIGLALSLPIFEGGLRVAQVAQARAVLNQAQENERSVRDAIVLTLEQTWASLQDAVQTVAVQEKFLVAAEERAKISQAQYSVGFINYDNWTIIEDSLVSAKKNFLDAQTNALIAKANWVQAKGETLEYED